MASFLTGPRGLTPWIEDEILQSLDCKRGGRSRRRAHIVQVLERGGDGWDNLDVQDDGQDCVVSSYLVISDGRCWVKVVWSGSKIPSSWCRCTQRRGSLIRLGPDWQVSTTRLCVGARASTLDAQESPLCLQLTSVDDTVLSLVSDASMPILGPPQDVHQSVEVRRLLASIRPHRELSQILQRNARMRSEGTESLHFPTAEFSDATNLQQLLSNVLTHDSARDSSLKRKHGARERTEAVHESSKASAQGDEEDQSDGEDNVVHSIDLLGGRDQTHSLPIAEKGTDDKGAKGVEKEFRNPSTAEADALMAATRQANSFAATTERKGNHDGTRETSNTAGSSELEKNGKHGVDALDILQSQDSETQLAALYQEGYGSDALATQPLASPTRNAESASPPTATEDDRAPAEEMGTSQSSAECAASATELAVALDTQDLTHEETQQAPGEDRAQVQAHGSNRQPQRQSKQSPSRKEHDKESVQKTGSSRPREQENASKKRKNEALERETATEETPKTLRDTRVGNDSWRRKRQAAPKGESTSRDQQERRKRRKSGADETDRATAVDDGDNSRMVQAGEKRPARQPTTGGSSNSVAPRTPEKPTPRDRWESPPTVPKAIIAETTARHTKPGHQEDAAYRLWLRSPVIFLGASPTWPRRPSKWTKRKKDNQG